MAGRAHPRRYAQAVFEIALAASDLDRWQSDLAKIATASGDAEVLAYLENPKLPFEEKAKLLSVKLLDISPKALNLVHLLLVKGRLSIIGQIAREYQLLLYRQRGIEPAEVTTAVPLDEKEKYGLVERLGAIFGKKIVLQTRVEPELLGGVTVKIDDRLLDGSTRSQLAALHKDIVGTGI